jgi:hypothetical protein
MTSGPWPVSPFAMTFYFTPFITSRSPKESISPQHQRKLLRNLDLKLMGI